MRKLLAALAAVSAVASAPAAYAATASATFDVKVNITTACAVSATEVDFGDKSTIAGTEEQFSTVEVTCNPGTAYNLSFATTSGTLTKSTSLVNGTNSIGADLDLGTAAAASGTGTGSHQLSVKLQAASYPTTGAYLVTETVNVIY